MRFFNSRPDPAKRSSGRFVLASRDILHSAGAASLRFLIRPTQIHARLAELQFNSQDTVPEILSAEA